MILTEEQLRRVFAGGGGRVLEFLTPLNTALERWEIRTPAQVAAFIAHAAHESAEFFHMRENLNYSAESLLRLWPNRFTPLTAAQHARQPEAIANIVYANRMGNGDSASGDGWRFRGGGIFQLTGREAFRRYSIASCKDADTLLVNPELIESPEYACDSAGWFWADRELNAFADAGDFIGMTKRINGGTNGLEARTAYWRRAIAALR